MSDLSEALHFEIRRLREVVERQYLELAWQQSELRVRGGKAKIVKFSAGPLARSDLDGNAVLLRAKTALPSPDVWPNGSVPALPLIPNCGFASYAIGREQVAAIGMSVCGLDEVVVEQVTAMVEERLRRMRNFRPVFLMDITRTEIFRRRGFAYEYFATASERERRLADRLNVFNAERLDFLKRKWGLSGIINFGSRSLEAKSRKSTPVPREHSQRHVNQAVDQLVFEAANNRAASRAA